MRRHSRPVPGGPPLLSELLEHVLGLMHPRDAARAAAVSREWCAASRAAARPALARLFGADRAGKLLASLGAGGALARLEAHAAEAAAVPSAAGDASKVQPKGVVTPAVRAVATEWLIEVCWDWKLESTTVFLGVRYLDLWLATTPVEQLSKFQGIAISCLRVAFTHSRDARGRRDLSKPAVWADVCDGAASPGDVSAACRLVTKLLKGRPAARSGDTAKLALRRLWYQMLEAGYMTVGKVYVYMLASFLLHLSLLDAPLSRDTPPTLLATGALSAALDAYGFDPWPACVEARSPLLRREVDAVVAALRAAQAGTAARQLRTLWTTGYNYEASHEWLFLRSLVAAPANAGGVPLERGAGRRPAALVNDAPAGGGDGMEVDGPAAAEAQQQEQQQQQAQAPQAAQQAAADEDDGDEVDQPMAAFAAAGAVGVAGGAGGVIAAPGPQPQAAAARGGVGVGGAASDQGVVAEEEEVGDSGTSRAAAAAEAAGGGGAGPSQPPAAAAQERVRRSGAAAQQPQPRKRAQAAAAAPARQLRQRRARRGAGGDAGPSQAASQSGSAATGDGATQAPPAAAAAEAPRAAEGDEPAAAAEPLPFSAEAEARAFAADSQRRTPAPPAAERAQPAPGVGAAGGAGAAGLATPRAGGAGAPSVAAGLAAAAAAAGAATPAGAAAAGAPRFNPRFETPGLAAAPRGAPAAAGGAAGGDAGGGAGAVAAAGGGGSAELEPVQLCYF